MKISKIVTMKDLDTGENKKVKIDTKEIREFNFPKKAYIINKVFIDNLWLKIAVLVWVLILSALLILAKISQNYGFLSILILISLITITIVANFQIARLYFFSEEENRNIEKRLLIRWAWASTEGIELPENTEAEERCYDFLKKVFEEINKFAIRFYFYFIAHGNNAFNSWKSARWKSVYFCRSGMDFYGVLPLEDPLFHQNKRENAL